MKLFFTTIYLLLLIHLVAFSQDASTSFNKPDYFKAISSTNLLLIDNQLKLLNDYAFIEKNAYQGALLMKKAGLVTNLSDKLSFFKEGRLKLEEAIEKDKNNSEYRFLRIIIQENAPSFLNYNNHLEEDSKQIISNLNNLSPEVQQAIRNYTKQSKALLLNE
jgi:hypothetical protein